MDFWTVELRPSWTFVTRFIFFCSESPFSASVHSFSLKILYPVSIQLMHWIIQTFDSPVSYRLNYARSDNPRFSLGTFPAKETLRLKFITADSTVGQAIFLNHLLNAIGHILAGMPSIHLLQSQQAFLNWTSSGSYHTQTTSRNAFPFTNVHPSNERLTSLQFAKRC
jgi:hypothetical protein